MKLGEAEARKWLRIEMEEPNGCAHTSAAIRWALGRITDLERAELNRKLIERGGQP